MAVLNEVRLGPGWLEEDIKRARARLVEWHGTPVSPFKLAGKDRQPVAASADRAPTDSAETGADL